MCLCVRVCVIFHSHRHKKENHQKTVRLSYYVQYDNLTVIDIFLILIVTILIVIEVTIITLLDYFLLS